MLAIAVSLLTELISNTAAVSLLLPTFAYISCTTLQINPFLTMITAAYASSFAFILPVSTPPNATAYSTEYVEMKDMIKTGALLDVIAGLLFVIMLFTLGSAVFGIDASLPEWAASLAI